MLKVFVIFVFSWISFAKHFLVLLSFIIFFVDPFKSVHQIYRVCHFKQIQNFK